VVFDDYAGASMVAGLFWAETSNQFYILRAAWRRKGLEDTIEYQAFLWIYAILYIISRGIVYVYNTYFIVFSLNIQFYIKVAFLPNLFLSHAWLIFILGMLWKSIPNWYSNSKEIENSSWWIRGRELFKKYTKDAPWVYINSGVIVMYSTIIPIACAYYAHFIDQSWGIQ
jgi:hypothetical protein